MVLLSEKSRSACQPYSTSSGCRHLRGQMMDLKAAVGTGKYFRLGEMMALLGQSYLRSRESDLTQQRRAR